MLLGNQLSCAFEQVVINEDNNGSSWGTEAVVSGTSRDFAVFETWGVGAAGSSREPRLLPSKYSSISGMLQMPRPCHTAAGPGALGGAAGKGTLTQPVLCLCPPNRAPRVLGWPWRGVLDRRITAAIWKERGLRPGVYRTPTCCLRWLHLSSAVFCSKRLPKLR